MENNDKFRLYGDNNQIASKFSSANWSKLSLQEKVDLCQQVENDFAKEKGIEPCKVVAKAIEGNTFGQYTNANVIELNSYVLESGCFKTTYQNARGETVSEYVKLDASNWNAFETVIHEGTHHQQNSEGRIVKTYFDPDIDYDLYRIQPVEKEAKDAGYRAALEAMSKYETDSKVMSEYVAHVRADSFESSLLNAKFNYNDPDIEKTMDQVIADNEQGQIRTNPSLSYEALQKATVQVDINNSASEDIQSTDYEKQDLKIPNPEDETDKSEENEDGLDEDPDKSEENEDGLDEDPDKSEENKDGLDEDPDKSEENKDGPDEESSESEENVGLDDGLDVIENMDDGLESDSEVAAGIDDGLDNLNDETNDLDSQEIDDGLDEGQVEVNSADSVDYGNSESAQTASTTGQSSENGMSAGE